MANEVYLFKSCANEYIGTSYTPQTTQVYCLGLNQTQTQTAINTTYKGTNLEGLVTGIGYGWQKFETPKKGKITFTIRGSAGGNAIRGTLVAAINPINGVVTYTSGAPNDTNGYNRGGRGAKICGSITLPKGAILYMLVGLRGAAGTSANTVGAGGGGASVVLLDNPLGAYTFTPLNRKVDVLFVAGGGAGGFGPRKAADSISAHPYCSTTLPGKDAIITNGTNTNGGNTAGSYCYTGAGLTGAGAQTASASSWYPTPAILSGSPSETLLWRDRAGGWGGGGSGHCSGGCGGGYSGGNAGAWTKGSVYTTCYGGTSYINPALCQEISRGYATVADDSHRNLANPWTAYGAIELAYEGRSPDKYILALDADGYKYFDGETEDNLTPTNTWQLLDEQSVPDDNIYTEFGTAPITSIDGLKSPATFLVSSPEIEEFINFNAMTNTTIVKMNTDVSTADVSQFLSMTAVNDTSKAIVKFAVSKDYGKTWQTYDSGIWTDIDITDKQVFKTNGYDITFYSAIPIIDWQSYNPKVLRFAFCVEQTDSNNVNPFLSQLAYTANLVGSWRHCGDTQVSYEYITDDTVEVTFKESGNYKVNYLDSIT